MPRTPRTAVGRRAARLPWWLSGLVGLAGAVLGVLLVARPFASLDVLVALLSVALVVAGLGRWSDARRDSFLDAGALRR